MGFAMINQIIELMQNEEGAESLEYVAIVAIIIAIGVVSYSPGISSLVSTAFSAMTNAVPT